MQSSLPRATKACLIKDVTAPVSSKALNECPLIIADVSTGASFIAGVNDISVS